MAITDTEVPRDWITFKQEDRATLDFLNNIKTVSAAVVGAVARQRYEAIVAARRAAGEPVPSGPAEVAPIVDPMFEWRADRFISRHAQEMLWPRLFAALAPDENYYLAELERPVPNPKGSLRLNPEVALPPYYEIDYHIQPGGMHGKPMIPWVMQVGRAVYHSGANDRWEIERGVAAAIPAGQYRRILDLGCGLGSSTIVLKERFPDAEVYGIDLSAPFLNYAHRVAERFGIAIHFSQQNAERTDFPDAFFDVVSSCILFHEIPDEAAQNVIAEAYRILAPGGLLNIGDVAAYRHLDPYRAFFSDWQTEHNGEPYWRQNGFRNLPEMMRAVGFREIGERPLRPGAIQWITQGRK
ncbi:MAG: class I SAM-dependent methyltransferase [Chloroflexi bacterium]|nr:class I SAM-dependent methyltransferase [Chloroflexota bacterium]GIW11331.1 MAG: hypothetical protein KatS3mg061_2388 [Dehalococcoidia bacterium]